MNLPPNYLKEHPEESAMVDTQLSAKVKSGERWAGRQESQQIEQIFANSIFWAAGSRQQEKAEDRK